ncbi:PE family protein [Mycobacterium simulans]|uniref:PE family protein n=1 Tax=Mycobacterium simulans TaxID=627089 RepID=UPI001CD3302D|nr:PE family protein [Mycobacterium simulans]
MSSYVIAAPAALAAASTDIAGISEAIRAANAAAAPWTTGIAAAAGDEVSEAIATLFGTFGREYQALSAETVSVSDQFAQAFQRGADAYARMDLINASPLRPLLNNPLVNTAMGLVNMPTQLLMDRPLYGDGADGAPGTGQNGGDGGIISGNGGNGGTGGGSFTQPTPAEETPGGGYGGAGAL